MTPIPAWSGPGPARGWPPPSPATPELAPGGVPLRPLGLGEILSGSVVLVRRAPVPILVLSAVLATLGRVAQQLISNRYTPYLRAQALPVGQPLTPAQQQAYLSSAAGLLGVEILILLALFIFLIVTWEISAGVLARPIGSAVLGGRPGFAESLRGSRIGPVLLIGLLQSLAFAGPWAATIGLVAAGVAPLAVLAGACAMILMLWLMVTWSLAPVAVVLERLGPMAAIARSWRLVRGRFWRTFGFLLLAGLVAEIAYLLLSVPYYLARLVAGGAGGLFSSPSTAWQAAAIVTAIVATIPTVPVMSGIVVLIYADARMRKEGLDLLWQQEAQQETPWRRLTGAERLALWRQRGPGQPAGQPRPAWQPSSGTASGGPARPASPW